ncbi:MAG: SDR family oxidoreductase [Serpentinimonas sp.]|jgi:NAD(P)-dependent dehydrogenase (short-subunit alcohol dehydrogenase family)|nr:SDR family oxidoreductase [Serpentinimonas sp.]
MTPHHPEDFHGTVSAVTGAARGIGLGIARQFLQRGGAVALIDRDLPTLQKAAQELAGFGSRVSAHHCDVSDGAQVMDTFAAIHALHGRLDNLVNNAGVAVFKPLAEVTFEDWNEVMATNLSGPFYCTQACAPYMRQQRSGSIVNIASISGLRASTLRVAYGTSKAALIHLTKQQATELGLEGIRVNAVAPGPVETEMAKLVHSAAIRADYANAIPLKRYGEIDEIAATTLFLCSAGAGYINGQVIAVDGGFDAAGVGIPSLRQHLGGL